MHSFFRCLIQLTSDQVARDIACHSDIVATLIGTESFPTISCLNRLLIMATHFGDSGHLRGITMLKCSGGI